VTAGARLRDLRRAVSAHRRLLAAGLVALGAACTIGALSPHPPPTVTVITAAHDLAGGVSVDARDVTVAHLPAAAVPSGAFSAADDVVGRLLAAPVRAGEVVTDVRLLGAGLLAGYGAGTVAVPIHVGDAAITGLLRVGDHVDVLATSQPPDGSAPVTEIVARGVPVIALPDANGELPAYADGGLLVVAATPAAALQLTNAGASGRLSIVVTAPDLR
jgi:Flp pilus assembly protein CpaB